MSELFSIERLLRKITDSRRYHEFLRVSAMSAGVYMLPAGGLDQQKPHKEDEVYYVIRGRAKMRLDTYERTVREGDIIFVEAGLKHRFVDIEQELVVLVIFAPAESS
jgi:mannose-6-phosphate isomerase-like protein (cupin superfamily)